VDEFIHGLKDFIELITLDAQAKSECKIVIEDFALALAVNHKFEEIWKKINI
jgi:hypothetical protein